MNDQLIIGIILLIGFSIMLGVCATMAVYKLYLRRKRKQLLEQLVLIRIHDADGKVLPIKKDVKPDYDEDDCEGLLP